MLLSLYAHLSRPFWTGLPLAYPAVQKTGAAAAFQIAIDAAEPKMELYEYFVEEGLKGKRILIIHTLENRRAVWREFTRENCGLYGVLELVPLLDNPNQYVLPVVTRFEGRAAPER